MEDKCFQTKAMAHTYNQTVHAEHSHEVNIREKSKLNSETCILEKMEGNSYFTTKFDSNKQGINPTLTNLQSVGVSSGVGDLSPIYDGSTSPLYVVKEEIVETGTDFSCDNLPAVGYDVGETEGCQYSQFLDIPVNNFGSDGNSQHCNNIQLSVDPDRIVNIQKGKRKYQGNKLEDNTIRYILDSDPVVNVKSKKRYHPSKESGFEFGTYFAGQEADLSKKHQKSVLKLNKEDCTERHEVNDEDNSKLSEREVDLKREHADVNQTQENFNSAGITDETIVNFIFEHEPRSHEENLPSISEDMQSLVLCDQGETFTNLEPVNIANEGTSDVNLNDTRELSGSFALDKSVCLNNTAIDDLLICKEIGEEIPLVEIPLEGQELLDLISYPDECVTNVDAEVSIPSFVEEKGAEESNAAKTQCGESHQEKILSSSIPSTVEELADLSDTDTEDIPKKERPTKKEKKKPILMKISRMSKEKADNKPKSFQKPLWEFLLDVLGDKTHNPSVIKWLDSKRGSFKIVKGPVLANLWTRARNRTCNLKYEFFARTIRHYYTRNILQRMPGKKLQYQFHPEFDWRTYNKQCVLTKNQQQFHR